MKSRTSILEDQIPGLKSRQQRSSFFESPAVPSKIYFLPFDLGFVLMQRTLFGRKFGWVLYCTGYRDGLCELSNQGWKVVFLRVGEFASTAIRPNLCQHALTDV